MGSSTEVQIFKRIVTFTKEKFVSDLDASPEISMKSHKEQETNKQKKNPPFGKAPLSRPHGMWTESVDLKDNT